MVWSLSVDKMKQLPARLLHDIEERLVAALNPEQIFLFGSYAYGEPTEHSDIDLLVIVPHSDQPSYRRAQVAHGAMSGLGMPTDILVMTRAEVNRKATVPSSLVTLVLRKGKVIMGEAPNVNDDLSSEAAQNADEAQREEVKQWLLKSQRDLKVSQVLLSSEAYLLDSAVYHCQQAAEKALKGYLAHQKLEIVKTHNLDTLLELCIPFSPGFQSLKVAAKILTPYAADFRYPGDNVDPGTAEAEKAVEMAKQIVSFVIEQLPNELKNFTA